VDPREGGKLLEKGVREKRRPNPETMGSGADERNAVLRCVSKGGGGRVLVAIKKEKGRILRMKWESKKKGQCRLSIKSLTVLEKKTGAQEKENIGLSSEEGKTCHWRAKREDYERRYPRATTSP